MIRTIILYLVILFMISFFVICMSCGNREGISYISHAPPNVPYVSCGRNFFGHLFGRFTFVVNSSDAILDELHLRSRTPGPVRPAV